MSTITDKFDVKEIQDYWIAFYSIFPIEYDENDHSKLTSFFDSILDSKDYEKLILSLSSLLTEESYDNIVLLMNTLLDEIGEDEEHPLFDLLNSVGDIVFEYEKEHYPI